jgi:hypothetical protein
VLALKDTWTKGGRPREVPVRNAEQRQLLEQAKALAGRGSLIPADRTYAEQLRRFEHQCSAAGIHRVQGFQHQYAQVRYRELAGWAAPAAGGPRSWELTDEQKAVDREARLTISAELGHERGQVTAVYFGAVMQSTRCRSWKRLVGGSCGSVAVGEVLVFNSRSRLDSCHGAA